MPVNDYIPLTKSVSLFPDRPHINTIRRFAGRHGCKGVRLRTVKYSRQRLTRPEWVHEFLEAVINATHDPMADAPVQSTSHAVAEARLDSMGV